MKQITLHLTPEQHNTVLTAGRHMDKFGMYVVWLGILTIYGHKPIGIPVIAHVKDREWLVEYMSERSFVVSNTDNGYSMKQC
jgi:hypothetical protein